MFLLVLVCCMSVCPSDYLKRNKQMCMKYLLEVCLGPKANPLSCGNDPWYDPGSLLSIKIITFDGDVQSMADCLDLAS